MAEKPGMPGQVNDGPTLSNEFYRGGGAAIIQITVHGDDTLSGSLNGGQVMGLATSGPADEKYVQYNDAGVVGEAVARGFLLEPVQATTAKGDQPGLLLIGFVAIIEANVIDIDAAAKVDFGDKFAYI